MANQETVKKVFALVFFKFPGRKPESQEDLKLAFKIWLEIFGEIPDKVLMNAASRFVAEVTKLYPDDDPFAMINQLANPKLIETEGDAVELAFEAAAKFGRYREGDAMTWLKEKSPLIAACVKRIGFLDLCNSEEPDVIRGQLRAIFKTEKARSKELGGIVESASTLSEGSASCEKLLRLTDGIGKPRLAILPEVKKDAA